MEQEGRVGFIHLISVQRLFFYLLLGKQWSNYAETCHVFSPGLIYLHLCEIFATLRGI